MEREELIFQKRLIDLSRTAYQRGIVMFSDFLNLNELNILHTLSKEELYSGYDFWRLCGSGASDGCFST